jgi:myo-inositol 2-dehydrogenase/D-chiro-inositol 1-dehydrogenase
MVVSENSRTHSAFVATEKSISGANMPYFFLERYTDSYLREWRAFVDYVAHGGPSPVSGNDGRAPVVIGLAAWQSIREGRPITIDQG